jgi:hypothetical protein
MSILTRSRLVVPLIPALLWIGAPADAGSGKAGCPEGSGCVWTETNFEGSRTQVPSNGCIQSKIRSAVNRSDDVVVFYLGGSCQGPQAGRLNPGEENPEIDAQSATGNCEQDTVDPCGAEPIQPAPG